MASEKAVGSGDPPPWTGDVLHGGQVCHPWSRSGLPAGRCRGQMMKPCTGSPRTVGASFWCVTHFIPGLSPGEGEQAPLLGRPSSLPPSLPAASVQGALGSAFPQAPTHPSVCPLGEETQEVDFFCLGLTFLIRCCQGLLSALMLDPPRSECWVTKLQVPWQQGPSSQPHAHLMSSKAPDVDLSLTKYLVNK